MKEIQGEDYSIQYTPNPATFYFRGELSLGGPSEYTPITELLDTILSEEPAVLVLNLQQLEFLNSSGISLLSKFVINARKKKTTQIVVQGSKSIPWQEKSLKNLIKLLPSLQLELE